MSLVVWLPMTKDLRNQGLSDVTVTNNGATFNSAGKLGGCYTFTNQIITVTPTTLLKESFDSAASLACWVKLSSSHNSWAQCLTFGVVGTAWTQIYFGIDINGSGIPYVNVANGSNNTNCSSNTAIKDGNWHHICATFTTGTIKIYIDGMLKNSASTSYTPAWANATVFSIGGNSSEIFKNGDAMNDVRLYDHCLSPMEVKELSKGLVLHYPLNNNGWGQENLLSRYVVPGQAAPTSTAAGGRTTWLGDYKITIPATENADTYFRLFTTKQLTANAVYTISCQVSGLKDGSFYRFPLYAQSNTGMGVLNLDHNGLCFLTFTMTYDTQTAATGVNGETVYICFMDDAARNIVSGQGVITLSNFKLEEGSKPTPWCPNSADELATKMGMNDGIEYDTSGFGNNGTRVGEFSWSSDTSRYLVSTVFENDCSQYIHTPYLSFLKNGITMSCWAYQTSASNTEGTTQYIMSQGRDSYYNGFSLRSSNGTALLCINTGNSEKGLTSNINIVGRWHHIVGTYDGTKACIYIDGELKNSYTMTGDIDYSMASERFVVGKMSYSYTSNSHYFPFVGNISDVRIYATALSASDVLSLYQNSAYIDSSGNVYGAVHTEA